MIILGQLKNLILENNMKKLTKPILYCVITQPFGGNPDMPIAWKEDGTPITYRSIGLRGHNGIDLRLTAGRNIYAAHSGIVVRAEFDKGFGNFVAIKSVVDGIITRYGHNERLEVKEGDCVEAGQLIAIGGNTGWSRGAHCHFDLAQIDKNGNIINQNNGFGGRIDPRPFFGKDFEDMRVDERYGQPRTWATFLAEKRFAFDPATRKKLGRLPTNREINMFVYGHWLTQEIQNETIRTTTNWITKEEKLSEKQPIINQIV